MKELSIIQKREKLNRIFAVDEGGNGGANHEYVIYEDVLIDSTTSKHEMRVMSKIQFQNGARNEEGSIHGVIDSDLLEIVRDRLKAFQAGPFSSEYNAHALKHIEEALHCMNARVEDRIKRNVFGRNEK
ncbi:ABC transporter ATPase [Hathewaya histolytica]|uniref:ABC transporter ATPase n=1 Tax=Hathewaya histolytica TaxID=1498 RepID=UPI003B67088D